MDLLPSDGRGKYHFRVQIGLYYLDDSGRWDKNARVVVAPEMAAKVLVDALRAANGNVDYALGKLHQELEEKVRQGKFTP